MLKHRFSALMIFHDAETPLYSTVHFSDAETPLCSTDHFSDAETPLRNTGDHFPIAETPLLGTFHLFSSHRNIPFPHHFHSRNNSVQHLFRPFPLPLLKHRLSATFSSVSPMPKHHCSAFFSSPSHHLSHSPSLTKQFRPAIVSPLSLLKLHLPATFHHLIHDAETPSFSTL
jgi:hypothetical protein